ncbi:DNA-binding response regulator, OmpR family, contains REC and winged-helix (wHTH) domain [Eubacterium ruminantium]|nr:DNA-binding response regulator, OmpR family, contains REC and winged-helix (wHTH) domain [Eubacterium ruminantium]
MKILIIEDDNEINKLLATYLEKNGHETISSFDGVDGLNKIRKYSDQVKFNTSSETFQNAAENDTCCIDMILLDMMLPGFSGDEIITKIRAFTDIPIIVISAVSNLDDRLYMMQNGADDYIIKPFELPDVLVRIEAVMRRYSQTSNKYEEKNTSAAAPGKKLSYGSIIIDISQMTVSVNGNELLLTSKEFEILKLMMENPTKLFSKANLYESIWNEEYFPEDQSLKVHMSNLRSKLKKYDDFDYIETIWGMGYRLRKIL